MGDQSTECDEASQSTGQDSHYEEEYDLDSTSSEEGDCPVKRRGGRGRGQGGRGRGPPEFQPGSNEIDNANVVKGQRRATKPSTSTQPTGSTKSSTSAKLLSVLPGLPLGRT